MDKKINFTKVIISNDDVLLKTTCIKSGLKASGLHLPDDMSDESKKATDGEWTKFEIVKVGKNVESFDVGQIMLYSKQPDFPMNFMSNNGEDAIVGAERFTTYPARLIEIAIKKEDYEL